MSTDNPTAETIDNQMPTPKIKHDWYQTQTHVIVTIFVKNSENVKVSYEKCTLSLSTKIPSGSDYSLELDLAHHVVPEQCWHKVLPCKIELNLKKREGLIWNSLEGNPCEQDPVQPIPQEIVQASSEPPRYPSSYKKSRDWNKVVMEIEKQEGEVEPEGDEAVNALFQKIYCSGSDEVKRAMNKSYQESGGTVLSTDWSDIGSRNVIRQTPNGVEWRSWDH